jgi:alkylated DNA nucleotide flippase Atl1
MSFEEVYTIYRMATWHERDYLQLNTELVDKFKRLEDVLFEVDLLYYRREGAVLQNRLDELFRERVVTDDHKELRFLRDFAPYVSIENQKLFAVSVFNSARTPCDLKLSSRIYDVFDYETVKLKEDSLIKDLLATSDIDELIQLRSCMASEEQWGVIDEQIIEIGRGQISTMSDLAELIGLKKKMRFLGGENRKEIDAIFRTRAISLARTMCDFHKVYQHSLEWTEDELEAWRNQARAELSVAAERGIDHIQMVYNSPCTPDVVRLEAMQVQWREEIKQKKKEGKIG